MTLEDDHTFHDEQRTESVDVPETSNEPVDDLGSTTRYARQQIFPGIGNEGQARLGAARVAIIGCGALGTVFANNLGRAGVGHLRLIDRDFVEGNNLQRQILFDEDDARQRMPKAIACAQHLGAINSDIEVEALVSDVTADNIEELIEGSDVVLDATDNFETRYLLNDASVSAGIPWIYSAVIAAHGVTMNVQPGESACLRCIYPDQPLPGTTPTCETAGVLNGIVGVIGGIATTEAIKLIVGPEKVARGLCWIDLWENTIERIEVPRDDACPACGQHHYEFLDAPLDEGGTTLCGRNAVQVRPPRPAGTAGGQDTVDLEALATRLRPLGAVTGNGFLLRCRLDGYDITVFPDARAIVKGTADPSVARAVYARYIGM